jgi:Zn finger protein HypA/HybF involved in hydrogenase expression
MNREERKEAIKQLQGCIIAEEHGKDGKPNGNVTCELTKDILDTAIKALEQEPCENAISREDALMALTGEWTEITDEIIHRFIKRIKALPPVNPQPKTGHWIISPNDCFATCSECGLSGDKGIFKHYRWCPICGAKMSEIPTGSDPQESEKVN